MYIAFKGWDSDTLWLYSFNGEDWSGEECIPGAPHDSVTLSVYGDRLLTAFNQADHTLWLGSYDGRRWALPERLVGRTNRGPALEVFSDSLYIAYKGWNNNTLWVNRPRISDHSMTMNGSSLTKTVVFSAAHSSTGQLPTACAVPAIKRAKRCMRYLMAINVVPVANWSDVRFVHQATERAAAMSV